MSSLVFLFGQDRNLEIGGSFSDAFFTYAEWAVMAAESHQGSCFAIHNEKVFF